MGNDKIKKIMFLTGSRADYGKLKSLMKESQKYFDIYIYICGMHYMDNSGHTFSYIFNDFSEIYNNIADTWKGNNIDMAISLSEIIESLNSYIKNKKPDLIVINGDRIEALAGAICGMLNNVCIAHIEGGEVTGTIDESIRHSISKISQLHFVSNTESKLRLLQLGEKESNIHVIGSPDIDIMVKDNQNLIEIMNDNDIKFGNYAIFIYHPVVTELSKLNNNINEILRAIISSDLNYIIIYPNNDKGNDIIIEQFEFYNFESNLDIKLFNNIKFEDFLTLLRYSNFIIGNSSAGIREACIYGIPCIDIGTRQSGRYNIDNLKNIQHCTEDKKEILHCIDNIDKYRIKSSYFGNGDSAVKFVKIIKSINDIDIQKKFIDTDDTKQAIKQIYINEVCF
jgi:UDP-N-acetylglucosamine 2-epimerase (hydrolysing)